MSPSNWHIAKAQCLPHISWSLKQDWKLSCDEGQEKAYSPFTQEKYPACGTGCQQHATLCPSASVGNVGTCMGLNANPVLGGTSSIICLMMLKKNLVPPVLAAVSHYQLIGPRCSHCWNLLSVASCYIRVGAPWEGCLRLQTAWESQRLQLHKTFSFS